MASNVYEGMFIFDSGKYGRDPDGVSGAISRMIEEAGGEMLVSRLWEERRLAYPINGQKNFSGVLEGLSAGVVRLNTGQATVAIAINAISRAHLMDSQPPD